MAILVWSLECIVDELNEGDIWHLNETDWSKINSKLKSNGRGISQNKKWKMLNVFGSFIPVLAERRIINYPD